MRFKNVFQYLFFLFFFLACTKDVGLLTEVEFDFTESHQAEGFVNEPLASTFTIIPEEIVEGYNYSISYSSDNDNISFLTVDGESISEGTLLPVDNLSITLNFEASEPGTYQVTVTATDNFGFTETLELTYVISNASLVWTATTPTTEVLLGSSVPITVTLIEDTSTTGVTYERNYSLASGSGVFTETNNDPVVLNSFIAITPGTHELLFIPDELGATLLQFDLRDSNDQELMATINLDVVDELGTNEPPTAVDDNESTALNTEISFDPTLNDTDPENDVLSIIELGDLVPASSGTVESDANTVTFTPATNFEGDVSFTYAINDGTPGNDSQATITISVMEGNLPPSAVITANPLSGVAPLTVNFNANNSTDDDAITAYEWEFGDGSANSVAAEVEHTFTTPGTFIVTLTVTDVEGLTDTATITITVNAANEAPIAEDDVFTEGEGANLTESVFADNGNGADSDPNGDAFTVNQVNGSAANVGTTVPGTEGGEFTILSNGTLTFDNITDFDDLIDGESVTTSITYRLTDGTLNSNVATVSVTIIGSGTGNQAPIALNDFFTTSETGALNESVFADNGNGVDNDPDGDFFSVNQVDGSATNVGIDVQGSNGGTFNISANGSLTFTTDGDFDDLNNGESIDTEITYILSDGEANSTVATVTVFINGSSNPNQSPVAENDAFTVAENGTLNESVFDNNGNGADSDPDGDPITVVEVGGNTANVGITVAGTGGGEFTILPNGNITFDPSGDFDALNAGETGQTTITYRISDGTITSNAALVSVTVTGVGAANQAPVAQNDEFDILASGTLVGSVFDNNGNGADNDPDGDPITVVEVNGSPANVGNNVVGTSGGIFNLSADGTLTYDPSGDFDGLNAGDIETPFITYKISDGAEISNQAFVIVTVNGEGGPNEAPVAVASASSVTGIVPLTIDFTGSNSTDDVGVVSYSWTFGDGSSSLLPDPSYTYNSPGIFIVTLTVTDGEGLTSSDTVTITVTLSSFDEDTGIYWAPPGSSVTVVMNSGGAGSGEASLSVFANSNFSGILGSGSTSFGSGAPIDANIDGFNFVMPASGIAYFMGSHSASDLNSGTAVSIILMPTGEQINTSMNNTQSIPRN